MTIIVTLHHRNPPAGISADHLVSECFANAVPNPNHVHAIYYSRNIILLLVPTCGRQ
jgi:hypothetical protein